MQGQALCLSENRNGGFYAKDDRNIFPIILYLCSIGVDNGGNIKTNKRKKIYKQGIFNRAILPNIWLWSIANYNFIKKVP